MRHYEIMAIFDPDLEEEAIQSVVDRAVEAIRARGGVPGRVELWGKRRFAYELAHRWEGYYAVLPVAAEPGALAEVDRMLFLADEVLRHKVIRVPDQAASGDAPAPRAEAKVE